VNAPLLSVTDLTARHGLLTAVRGVSVTVRAGEVVGLVGANGAGKSTLLRTIAGAHPAAAGRVALGDRDVTDLRAYQRVREGIALVPEGRRLFPDLTVEENLLVAAGRSRTTRWDLDRVLAAFPMLRPLLRQRASSLSGGQQQATAIARALLTGPRLLLVDEVSLGLSPAAVDAVYASLATLTAEGVTMILVEQDLTRALSAASRVVCLREGQVVLTQAADTVSREQVVDAYFGIRESAVPADASMERT
jgi:branched-chain amino acid transport system ATP-binding protein